MLLEPLGLCPEHLKGLAVCEGIKPAELEPPLERRIVFERADVIGCGCSDARYLSTAQGRLEHVRCVQ